jgi:signal transduction histidine kinase/CheY-like chemotaxis protein
MHAPIHVFGSACFFVFGIIYLIFIDSAYMFFSNAAFGAACILNWFVLGGRVPVPVRSASFLAIVYLGLVNVAVHLGHDPMPMVFWGMSIMIAAAFMFELAAVLVWGVLTLGFYPLTAWLKAGPMAGRVLHLDPSQYSLLSFASYVGILSFLAYSFFLFRRRLDRALENLHAHANALQESRSFLAETQRVARIGSYEVDLRAGTWTCTSLLDDILGIDAKFAKTLEAGRALLHPEDRDEVVRLVREAEQDGPGSFAGEFRVARTDDGEPVWVHGRGIVVRGDDGRPARIIGTLQDICGYKRNEAMRRQLESRLFQSQKLESLGVLAGGIAHDFNNLLTGILANISIARSSLPRAESEPGMPLPQAEKAALRAAELTRQMLAFSGRGQFVIQPLDVGEALVEMVDLVRSNLASRKVEIRFDLGSDVPQILADASQIRQVAMNLIINAAEAMSEGPGTITLRTGVRDASCETFGHGFWAEDLPAGRHVFVEVADTGSGMDEATQARIFEPFFTTKFTGRGLGLAAVLGIVKGHRGAIGLRSALGQGMTFTLLFPAAPADAPRPVSSMRVTSEIPMGTGRVLVIDDEEMLRSVVRLALKRSGFEVVEAVDGESGLEIVRREGDRIDLVLLDLTMPRMGGVEVFAELKRIRPDLHVVLMSGFTRGNVLPMFGDAAPEDFLEKPFHHKDLLAIVLRNVRR